jgi:hypothetical protein
LYSVLNNEIDRFFISKLPDVNKNFCFVLIVKEVKRTNVCVNFLCVLLILLLWEACNAETKTECSIQGYEKVKTLFSFLTFISEFFLKNYYIHFNCCLTINVLIRLNCVFTSFISKLKNYLSFWMAWIQTTKFSNPQNEYSLDISLIDLFKFRLGSSFWVLNFKRHDCFQSLRKSFLD